MGGLRSICLHGKEISRLALDPHHDRATADGTIFDMFGVPCAGVDGGCKNFTAPRAVDESFLNQMHGCTLIWLIQRHKQRCFKSIRRGSSEAVLPAFAHATAGCKPFRCAPRKVAGVFPEFAVPKLNSLPWLGPHIVPSADPSGEGLSPNLLGLKAIPLSSGLCSAEISRSPVAPQRRRPRAARSRCS